MQILLVEDNPQTALPLMWILAYAGHIVTHHEVHTLEGVKMARQGPFGALLLDFSLPDPDGSQMYPVLHKKLKTAPMLAITAGNDRVARRNAHAFAFDTFVAKPIDIAELLNSLRKPTGAAGCRSR